MTVRRRLLCDCPRWSVSFRSLLLCCAGLGLAAASSPLAAAPGDYFVIQVVDEDTGRGVPLVSLKTVNGIEYITDSAGLAAINEPGLVGQQVFFHVNSHGYEFPADGFGYRGQTVTVEPGKTVPLKIRRLNIAERLYRVTGGGIYRDSVLLARQVPTSNPVLNGQVLGSDSNLAAVHRGRIYWFWGDTTQPRYPLGNFHVPGATSRLPAAGGLDPSVGVNLQYFLGENGFAKETSRLPGEGPTWIGALTSLEDAGGHERLFAHYIKVRPPMEVYQQGVVEFDHDSQQFKKVIEIPDEARIQPDGHHTFHYTEDGQKYVGFANPFPLVRVPAEAAAFADISRYEAFTCLKEGSSVKEPQLDRDAQGRLHYSWKTNTPPITPTLQLDLIRRKKMTEAEAQPQLFDAESGKSIFAHRGTVAWNAHRQRWVMIATEQFGTSLLGEVWYAEADTPLGPWTYAVKVVTHDKYSFYNPVHHAFFDQNEGRLIYFEGTYTHTFSGNEVPTPRYDYNQIMYRLDLADPRLVLPVAVYRRSGGDGGPTYGFREARDAKSTRHGIAFFACERPTVGTVPVFSGRDALGVTLGDAAPDSNRSPAALFHALPTDMPEPPTNTALLYEYVDRDKKLRIYATETDPPGDEYVRGEQPVCRVWKNPVPVWPVQ